MGFFDKASSKSAGAVSGGAQTQTGNAFNVGASAGDDLNINLRHNENTTYNNTVTDFGAIDGAFDFAEELGNSAIGAVRDLASNSLKSNSGILEQAVDVTENALQRVDESNRMASQTVLTALDYNQALIRESGQSEGATIAQRVTDNLPVFMMVGSAVAIAFIFKGGK